MRTLLVASMVLALLPLSTVNAQAHCEVPCGIYDDAVRYQLLQEHATTIEKSMKQIEELSAAPAKNANQLIRWVGNKEEHANKIQEIVTQYFMTQRIKLIPEDSKDHRKNLQQLELLHAVLVHAMKCKQTIDLENVEKLRGALGEFHQAYFGPTREGEAKVKTEGIGSNLLPSLFKK